MEDDDGDENAKKAIGLIDKQNNIFARELTKILLFITQIRIENVIPSLASTITVTLSHQTVSIERTIIS